jgi:hypothetical protein
MKRVLLTVVATAAAVSVFAQGTVQFINSSAANGVNAKIYGPESGNYLSKTGNTTAGTPAGTQTYTGAALAGSGYLAQVLAAPGAGAAESSLVAAASAAVSFRTGTGAGYFAPNSGATLSNVAKDAGVATIQVVAWDNSSGLYSTWALASNAWRNGLIAAGRSTLFNVSNIGGDFNTAPYLVGLTSFNFGVPEPSTMALAGLGAAALLIFRRRK